MHGWLYSLTRTIQQENAQSLLSSYSSLGNGRDKQNVGVIERLKRQLQEAQQQK